MKLQLLVLPMVSRKALILTATALAAAVPNLAELRAASRIVVWGGDRYGVTAVPEGLTNVVERSGALLRRPDHLADESSGRFGPSQLAQSLSELNGRRFQLQRLRFQGAIMKHSERRLRPVVVAVCVAHWSSSRRSNC